MAVTEIKVATPPTTPTNAGELIRAAEWGIEDVISSAIVQSVNITEEVITDTTQDQKGAVVSQLDYDRHWTMSMELIGDSGVLGTGEAPSTSGIVPGNITFEYNGHNWKVTSFAYTGTYNDKHKYTMSAERWTNFPA